MTDPTGRFSNRVREYALHRPRYPDTLFRQLPGWVFTPSSVVADIGCGTGIFTAHISEKVKKVFAVEPNRGMREAALRALADRPNVEVTGGRAEETGLADRSVDVIAAAQAFHWFDRVRARAEFLRILKPGGAVLLVWYERRTTGDEFLEGYEKLMLDHGTDYAQVDHRNVTPEIIAEFFHPRPVERITVSGEERMDFEGLRGRVISSSYMPGPDDAGFAPLMGALTELFERCQSGGKVGFHYDFHAYLCRMHPGTAGDPRK